MTKIIETDNQFTKDTTILMASTIAKQMQERSLSAFELAQETGTRKWLVSMSDYDCPVCGQPTIEPFSKKWLFFTIKRISFFKCTNEHCSAREVTVYPKDVSKAIEAMEDTETEAV